MEIIGKKLSAEKQTENAQKHFGETFGALCALLDADDNRSAIIAVEMAKNIRRKIEYGETKEVN